MNIILCVDVTDRSGKTVTSKVNTKVVDSGVIVQKTANLTCANGEGYVKWLKWDAVVLGNENKDLTIETPIKIEVKEIQAVDKYDYTWEICLYKM